MAINIFSAYEENRFLTRYEGQAHSMLGLVSTPDADLTGPESGVAAWLLEFACLNSHSACSSQTLASVALYHIAPSIPTPNLGRHPPFSLGDCFSSTSSISSTG